MEQKPIVLFGEVMLRLSPPGFQRFVQARSFEAVYGGGEANVAASLAGFGVPVRYVTRLPENAIGRACEGALRSCGIDTRYVQWGGDRLGIYFLEMGVASRASRVIYDRADSAFSRTPEGLLDWPEIFAGAGAFHWTGITPAVSEAAARECLRAVRAAEELGLTVSCDLNYRSKLWKWGKEASEVMPELVRHCDIAIGNEEDAAKVFGIHAAGADVTAGRVVAEDYEAVCEGLSRRFPKLNTIAITLRGSHSATHNTWSAVMWRRGEVHVGPTYDISPIVDRVGGGDAFAAGLLYGIRVRADDPAWGLRFALASSCLKHTIFGDANLVSVGEVERLMEGDASGRVQR